MWWGVVGLEQEWKEQKEKHMWRCMFETKSMVSQITCDKWREACLVFIRPNVLWEHVVGGGPKMHP